MPKQLEFQPAYLIFQAHLLHEFVVGGLVEEDEVVELVPRLALGPLLLLGLAAASLLLLRRLGRGRLGPLRVLFRTLQSYITSIEVPTQPDNLNNLCNFVS